MRSSITRRLVIASLVSVTLVASCPFATRAVYFAVAHVELARLNDERDTDSTLDMDTLSPANRAKSEAFLRKVYEAHRNATRRGSGAAPRVAVADQRP